MMFEDLNSKLKHTHINNEENEVPLTQCLLFAGES